MGVCIDKKKTTFCGEVFADKSDKLDSMLKPTDQQKYQTDHFGSSILREQDSQFTTPMKQNNIKDNSIIRVIQIENIHTKNPLDTPVLFLSTSEFLLNSSISLSD